MSTIFAGLIVLITPAARHEHLLLVRKPDLLPCRYSEGLLVGGAGSTRNCD